MGITKKMAKAAVAPVVDGPEEVAEDLGIPATFQTAAEKKAAKAEAAAAKAEAKAAKKEAAKAAKAPTSPKTPAGKVYRATRATQTRLATVQKLLATLDGGDEVSALLVKAAAILKQAEGAARTLAGV